MNFSGFSGASSNREMLAALELAFSQGRLPHAVLLEGSPGSGVRELSLLLARAALCTGEGERPCGVCPNCVKTLAGSHPDLFTAGGGGAARSFHVDVIREIRADAYVKPNEASCKAYVLQGAETMSEQAQNALLKILEEPPQNVLFVLTAVSAAAVLPTVRSRVQIFTLEGGGEQRADPALTEKIALAVCAPNEAELLFCTAPLLRDKDALRCVLDQLVLLFRDACVLRAGGNGCLSGQPGAAAGLCGALTRGRLLLLLQTAQEFRRMVDQNANTALLVTTLCARLRSAAGR